MRKVMLILLLTLCACDPGDWKPDAPPAPDCSEERQDLCDDSGVSRGVIGSPALKSAEHPELPGAPALPEPLRGPEKHGSDIHTMTWNNWDRSLFAQYSLEVDWCNGDGTPCLATPNKWYTAQWVDVNTTGRTRTLFSITVMFGWDGLGQGALPAGTFWICDEWVDNCTDLSGLSFSNTVVAGRAYRKYTLFRSNQWVEWKVWTLWVRPQHGTFAHWWPEATVEQFRYFD